MYEIVLIICDIIQCNPGYTVLIDLPSHWFPNVTLVTQFSLVPHLIGPSTQQIFDSSIRLNIWGTHPILFLGCCLENKVTYTDLLYYTG